jgi:hypothetical protein
VDQIYRRYVRKWSVAAVSVVAAVTWPALASLTYAQRAMSDLRAATSAAPPSEFVAVRELNSPKSTLDLVSTSTGSVLRTLRSFSELSHPSLTNNGLELSSNNRTVFSVWVDPNIAIEATPASGGLTRFVVDGLEPTLSPDGSSLAYVTGSSPSVGIIDLASGRTRMWQLSTLLNTARTHYIVPATNALAWFDHGSELAVLTSPAPVAISSPQSPRNPIAVTPPCITHSTASDANCLAVISTSGAPLRLEDIQALGSFGIYSGGSSASSTIISAQFKQRDSRLTWLTPDNEVIAKRAPVTVPGIVEDIDQTGRNVLYVNHSSELSYGVIRGGALQFVHRYFGEVDAAAW